MGLNVFSVDFGNVLEVVDKRFARDFEFCCVSDFVTLSRGATLGKRRCRFALCEQFLFAVAESESGLNLLISGIRYRLRAGWVEN